MRRACRIDPDLTAFGKIIGGGFPVGAIGGGGHHGGVRSGARAGARVISGGTYSGNPLSAAAGLADAEETHPGDAFAARRHGQADARRPERDLSRGGADAQASGDGSLFQIVPTDRPLTNYRDVPQDAAAFDWLDRLHRGLLCSGVIISHRGLSCVSSPMGEAEVDEVLGAFERAVAGLQG